MPLGIELRYRGVHPKAIRGLFHRKEIQHGFKCVDKGKRPRTRRDWKPNVQYKHLFSEALQCQVKVCVTTNALKRIDQAGGLDMYLLTTPAASKASIVADELRKSIVKEYNHTKQPLPEKQGPTSILSLVDQRLRDAGLRPQRSENTVQSSKIESAPASSAPSTTTQSSVPGASSNVAPPDTLQADVPQEGWKPIVVLPHQEEPYRMRSQRKTAIIQHILERKGWTDALSVGSVVHQSELARARRLVALKLKRQNRHQLLQQLPADSRKGFERFLKVKKRFSVLHRMRMKGLRSSGKRISKPALEAVRKAKIEWRRKVARRNNLVATRRGQARNETLKRIASNPEAAMFLRFAWLQTFVEEMPAGSGKEAWRALAEKYQPSTPGMLIDGVFVPATNKYRVASSGVGALKHRELPSVSPPALSPPPLAPDDDQTSHATAEDILQAANAVAFLPHDSQLLVESESERRWEHKIDRYKGVPLKAEVNRERWEQGMAKHARHSLNRFRDLRVRQYHADKLYELMRDMKQQHPRCADAIECHIQQKLQSLGTVIDSAAGITDACVKNGGLNGTVRFLLQAAAANRANSIRSDSTSSHRAAGASDRASSSGSASVDANRPKSAGLGATRTSSDSTESGTKRKSNTDEELLAGKVRMAINTRMTYLQRRKMQKMSKWLDDAWLRQHVVYDTTPQRLVLGNGMVLRARSRRQHMPDALWEELQAALVRIESEVAQSPLNVIEPPGGRWINDAMDRLEGRGRFTTLPGVPGGRVPS